MLTTGCWQPLPIIQAVPSNRPWPKRQDSPMETRESRSVALLQVVAQSDVALSVVAVEERATCPVTASFAKTQ